MTAHHFFAPFGATDDLVVLAGDEARHASRVLRIAPGEEITVSNGEVVVRAVVTEASPSLLRAEVRERTAHEAPAAEDTITVCPAVPKAGKLEAIIEDLTELGVDTIAPWFSARSLARWDEAKQQRNLERWHKVAFAAAKQSKRVRLPAIEMRAPLPGPGVVVLHEGASVRLRDVPGTVTTVVTGPEGGLSDDEIATFAAGGAAVASLGDQVLRTQTAAVAGAALVLARNGRLG